MESSTDQREGSSDPDFKGWNSGITADDIVVLQNRIKEVIDLSLRNAPSALSRIWNDTSLEDLSHIGNFLSGVGVLFAAISAAYIIRRNELQRQWIESFRNLYREFWENEKIAVVRRCITNDVEYEKILRPVLRERNKRSRNILSKNENDIIENIDLFCAALVRVKSIGIIKMNSAQEEIWSKLLYGNFWTAQAAKRPELRLYIVQHWDELISPSWYDHIAIIILRIAKFTSKRDATRLFFKRKAKHDLEE